MNKCLLCVSTCSGLFHTFKSQIKREVIASVYEFVRDYAKQRVIKVDHKDAINANLFTSSCSMSASQHEDGSLETFLFNLVSGNRLGPLKSPRESLFSFPFKLKVTNQSRV